jgi:hypothetical protein
LLCSAIADRRQESRDLFAARHVYDKAVKEGVGLTVDLLDLPGRGVTPWSRD